MSWSFQFIEVYSVALVQDELGQYSALSLFLSAVT